MHERNFILMFLHICRNRETALINCLIVLIIFVCGIVFICVCSIARSLSFLKPIMVYCIFIIYILLLTSKDQISTKLMAKTSQNITAKLRLRTNTDILYKRMEKAFILIAMGIERKSSPATPSPPFLPPPNPTPSCFYSIHLRGHC